MKQVTLKGEFTVEGKGLHTGAHLKATFCPAPDNHGYKVTITANVNGFSVSKTIIVGSPKFVLDEIKREPGYYTVKATCIDTQSGLIDKKH